MKKNLSELIDSLITTNIKIFMLVDKVQRNVHTVDDAKRIQDLNTYRSQLANAINEWAGERKEIKI